jgi:hypothetical protein
MIIGKLGLSTAISVLCLTALTTGASASTALRTDLGGVLLSGPTAITNTTSERVTGQFPGSGSWRCDAASFVIDVNSRTSTSSIAGTLTSLDFTSCSGWVSCSLSPDEPLPTVSILAMDGSATVTLKDLTIRCLASGTPPSYCYYTAPTVLGVQSNALSKLTFTNVSLLHVTGTDDLGASCGTFTAVSWAHTHIVQRFTNRTITVATT